jgi:hypothetical protein
MDTKYETYRTPEKNGGGDVSLIDFKLEKQGFRGNIMLKINLKPLRFEIFITPRRFMESVATPACL